MPPVADSEAAPDSDLASDSDAASDSDLASAPGGLAGPARAQCPYCGVGCGLELKPGDPAPEAEPGPGVH